MTWAYSAAIMTDTNVSANGYVRAYKNNFLLFYIDGLYNC